MQVASASAFLVSPVLIRKLKRALSCAVRKQLEEGAVSVRPRSVWLTSCGLNVYLRTGPYHFDHASRDYWLAVGISNVQAHEGEPKGNFKRFITALERKAKLLGYKVIRVEEVLNPELLTGLLAHGYVVKDPSEVSPTVYKELNVN